MSITRMSLVEVIVPKPRMERLVSCIQNFGSLQIEEVPLAVPGVRSYLHRCELGQGHEQTKKDFAEAIRALAALKPFFQDLPMADRKDLDESRGLLVSEEAGYLLLRALRLKRQAERLWRKRGNIEHDMEALSSYRHRLDQLSSIRASSELAESMSHLAIIIRPDEKALVKEVEERLAEITRGSSHVFQSKGPAKTAGASEVAILAFPEEYAKEVREMARRNGLVELRMPSRVRNLPLLESIDVLQDLIADLPKRLAEVEVQIDQFRTENHGMVTLLDLLCSDALSRLECIGQIAQSSLLVVVRAWMPSSDVPAFEHALHDQVGVEAVMSELDRTTTQAGQVPVRLENKSLVKPFEQLLKLLSVPLYGSFDPTLLMALAFPLFFGIILGDIAYGFLILCLSLWARRKWRHVPAARDITAVGIWCAAASMLFGVVFGEFLGDLGTRSGVLPLMVGGVRLIPLWQSREHIIDELLVVAIVVGLVHVVLGLVLGIYEAVHAGSRRHLWERVGLLLSLLAVVLAVAPLEVPFLPGQYRGWMCGAMGLAGVIMLVAASGPFGPIEVVSLVANVLSYSRLMALGVAGMVIANLANEMAASQTSYAVGALVALPIHALALALGIIEPTIHALRLHFVEFLPKFFEGDGRSYTPLRRKGEQGDE